MAVQKAEKWLIRLLLVFFGTWLCLATYPLIEYPYEDMRKKEFVLKYMRYSLSGNDEADIIRAFSEFVFTKWRALTSDDKQRWVKAVRRLGEKLHEASIRSVSKVEILEYAHYRWGGLLPERRIWSPFAMTPRVKFEGTEYKADVVRAVVFTGNGGEAKAEAVVMFWLMKVGGVWKFSDIPSVFRIDRLDAVKEGVGLGTGVERVPQGAK